MVLLASYASYASYAVLIAFFQAADFNNAAHLLISSAMSEQDIHKKRKRKRSKKPVPVANVETTKDTQFQNKKIKFDDDVEPMPAPVADLKARPAEIQTKNPTEKKVTPKLKLNGSDAEKVVSLTSEANDDTNKPKYNTKLVPGSDPKRSQITSSGKNKNTKKNTKKAPVTFYSDDESDLELKSNVFNLPSSFQDIKKRAESLAAIRSKLPISQHQVEIVNYITKNPVTVIIGETGSGKSTQIPQYLMPLNKKQIAVTQPRRVAASSLATRVSEEYGCKLGDEVGYQVRFANLTSHRTKLKYLTDGMLLRELMLDPNLTKYSTIIIDEAHERTVLTDLVMGFLKELLMSTRKHDLKLVIMSATLNAQLFSNFFNHAPILFVEGKMYPVTQNYLSASSAGEGKEDIVEMMVRCVVQVNLSELEGDILCFLPGQEEIDNCVSFLSKIAPHLPKEAPQIVPVPLYAALSAAQQLQIFAKLKGHKRKVILATNIAETSITVSGVKYVIDSGLRKIKVWRHSLGLSTLLTTPISVASAKQRAGRAGRESPGKVFRLYSEKVFNEKLPRQQESEIMRNDIVLPVLTLKKIGVDDLLNWSWLEHPGKDAIISALSTLYSLGALDDSGKITRMGYKMATLPLAPQLSVVLLTALDYGCLGAVIDIASCISVDNLVLNVSQGDGDLRDEINFKRRQFCPQGAKFGDLIALKEYFDHFMELNNRDTSESREWCKDNHFSFKGFKNVLRVRQQLKDYMVATIKQDDISEQEKTKQLRNLNEQLNNEIQDINEQEEEYDGFSTDLAKSYDIPSILKCFLKGYITNTAIGMPDRSYRTISGGQLISIHPSSNLFGKSNLDGIMYIEYVYTTKGYGRNCSLIELSWLQEIAPQILGAAKVHID